MYMHQIAARHKRAILTTARFLAGTEAAAERFANQFVNRLIDGEVNAALAFWFPHWGIRQDH